MHEHRDGGLEAVLSLAQFISVSRPAQGAGRGEGSICQPHHFGVAQDELYPEPGGFRASPQAVALDSGCQVVSSGCVSPLIEPQGNEPSLQFSHGSGVGAAGIHMLVPESLVALECLSALSGAALEEISGEGPQQRSGDADETG